MPLQRSSPSQMTRQGVWQEISKQMMVGQPALSFQHLLGTMDMGPRPSLHVTCAQLLDAALHEHLHEAVGKARHGLQASLLKVL